MRTFSSGVSTLLKREDTSGVYVVWIKRKAVNWTNPDGSTGFIPAIDIQDTTHVSDITIESVGTFTADSGLLIVEAPRLSKTVDRESYKISYIDPTFSKREMFENGLTGAEVVVAMVFLNTSDVTLNGKEPGEYLTALEDLVVVYGGTVDTQGYSIEPSEGKIIAVIECSSPMAALAMSNPYYTSKNHLQQKFPNDSAFNQVYEGSKGITLLWGKIPV